MIELSSGVTAIIIVVALLLIVGALELGWRDGWKAAKIDSANHERAEMNKERTQRNG